MQTTPGFALERSRRTSRLSVALIFSLCLVFAQSSFADLVGYVNGTVLDAGDNSPVAAAQVLVLNPSGGMHNSSGTNASGYFNVFMSSNLSFTLEIRKQGYVSAFYPVMVTPNQTIALGTVLLQKTSSVTLALHDPLTSRPVPGATIAYRSGSGNATAKSASDGKATLDMAPGSEITITHRYYGSKTLSDVQAQLGQSLDLGRIDLTPLETEDINIALEQLMFEVAVSRQGYGFYCVGPTIHRIQMSNGREAGSLVLPSSTFRIWCIDDEGWLYAACDNQLYWINPSTFAVAHSVGYDNRVFDLYRLRPGQIVLSAISGGTYPGNHPLCIINSQNGSVLQTIDINMDQALATADVAASTLYVTQLGRTPMSLKTYDVSAPAASSLVSSIHSAYGASCYELTAAADGAKLYFSAFDTMGIDVRTASTFASVATWNLGGSARRIKRSADGQTIWCISNGKLIGLHAQTGAKVREFAKSYLPAVDLGHAANRFMPYALDETNRTALIAVGSESKRDLRIQRLDPPTAAQACWPLYE